MDVLEISLESNTPRILSHEIDKQSDQKETSDARNYPYSFEWSI